MSVPIVGLGAAWIGIREQGATLRQYLHTPDWKNQMDRDLAVETIIAAIDAGVRFIDTAPWYGRGLSEECIGIALRSRPDLRNEITIVTKIGHAAPDDEYDFSYDAAMRSFEASQRRIGLDVFPLVHLHDPMNQPMDRVMGPDGVFAAMEKLQSEGRIKFLGVGANDPRTAATYIATRQFDAAIVVGAWSMINQSARTDLIPVAAISHTGLIAATALERGLLAAGYRNDAAYCERKFSGEVLNYVGGIQKLCNEYHLPLAAAALQWCTRQDSFAIATPGARTPEEARANFLAAEVLIPDDFWVDLDPLIKSWDCIDSL